MIFRWFIVSILLLLGQGRWELVGQEQGAEAQEGGVSNSQAVTSPEVQAIAIQMLRQKIAELNQESVPGLIPPNSAIHEMAVRVLRKKMDELVAAEQSNILSNSTSTVSGLAPANNTAMHDRALEILRVKLAQLAAWPENNPEAYREAVRISPQPPPKVVSEPPPAKPSFSIPPASLPQPVVVKRSRPKPTPWKKIPEPEVAPKDPKSTDPVRVAPPVLADALPVQKGPPPKPQPVLPQQPVVSVPPPVTPPRETSTNPVRASSPERVSASAPVSTPTSSVQIEFVEPNDPDRIVVVGSDSKPVSSSSNVPAPSSALVDDSTPEETALSTTTHQLPYVSTPLQERAPVVAEIKTLEKMEEGVGDSNASPSPAPKVESPSSPPAPANASAKPAVQAAPPVSSSPPVQRVTPVSPQLQNAMKSVILSGGGSVQGGNSGRGSVVLERDLTPEEIDQRKIQVLEYYLEDRITTQEYYRQRAKVKEVPIVFVNPPPPTRSKEQKLVKLLELYLVDEITPREYHQVRAMIISEP